MGKCRVCGKSSIYISDGLGICLNCIRDRWEEVEPLVKAVHRRAREKFNLPAEVPRDGQHPCTECGNECKIKTIGYCGLKYVESGKLKKRDGLLEWYYDPLPTNCVAAFTCAATGCGYPKYSRTNGVEYGYKNLAIFYTACSFNCLFCQNWHFRVCNPRPITPEELAQKVDPRTACICYFGGDPGPQFIHSIKTSELAIKHGTRVCWETNGNLNPSLLERAFELALESGGTIKFDLKAYDERVALTLCGVSNRRTLDNFKRVGKRFNERPVPPPVVASTLLVPGYIDEHEVEQIARFIAGIDPRIPYSLLAFYPQFQMDDLPTTPRKLALRAYEVAKSVGLVNVHIGNIHLLW